MKKITCKQAKTGFKASLAILALCLLGFVETANANPYSFAYSGRLTTVNGAPVQGPVNLEVQFYSQAEGGESLLLEPLSFTNVLLSEGVFQITIDLSKMSKANFHNVFSSTNPAYIEITNVSESVPTSYSRQMFNVVPYALKIPTDETSLVYTSEGKLKVGQLSTLTLESSGSSNTLQVKAPSLLDQSIVYTLPPSPITGYYLKTDASGNLTWGAPSGAGNMNTATYDADTNGVVDQALNFTGTLAGAITGTQGATVIAAGVDAAKIGGGSVSNAEFAYLDGVTSAIQTQLNAKEGTLAAGTSSQYYRGDKTWQTLNSTAVAEGTNLYFTDARARTAAVSDAIANGTTNIAPSQNAVYDALVLKSDTTHTHASDVTGAASSTDNAIARFDGATGKTIQNSVNVVIDDSGNLGVGNTSPATKLDVTGQVLSRVYNAGAATSFDWDNGNSQYTSASCSAMTFTNMRDGGSYSLTVQGATSGTCTFTQAGLTFKFVPANAATIASSHTVYTFLRMGSYVYVTWVSGF